VSEWKGLYVRYHHLKLSNVHKSLKIHPFTVWLFVFFPHFLPLKGPWKGPASLFEHIWISKSYSCFLPSMVKIGSLVLEKKMFSWKVDRQMTDAVPCHKLESGELKIPFFHLQKIHCFSRYYNFEFNCNGFSKEVKKGVNHSEARMAILDSDSLKK